MPKIDESVINFAVYEDATEYYGLAEVTMPTVASIVEEIKGAGIAGVYQAVILGHMEAMNLTFNFRTFTRDAVTLLEPRDHILELRAAQQGRDTVKGTTIVDSVKHTVVVRHKSFNPNKIAPAAIADASGEYAVSYWASYINDEQMFEIDVPNFKFVVNGVDYLEDVRKALGKQ